MIAPAPKKKRSLQSSNEINHKLTAEMEEMKKKNRKKSNSANNSIVSSDSDDEDDSMGSSGGTHTTSSRDEKKPQTTAQRKRAMYLRMFELMGLGNHKVVVNMLVTKVCNNIIVTYPGIC